MNNAWCILVAAVFEWLQFYADPKLLFFLCIMNIPIPSALFCLSVIVAGCYTSGELTLWLSSWKWCEIYSGYWVWYWIGHIWIEGDRWALEEVYTLLSASLPSSSSWPGHITFKSVFTWIEPVIGLKTTSSLPGESHVLHHLEDVRSPRCQDLKLRYTGYPN